MPCWRPLVFSCPVVLGAGMPAWGAQPMSYLRTFGPAADPVTRLNWGLLAVSSAVTLIIGALLLWAALRKRAPLPAPVDAAVAPGAAHGLAWIFIGTGLSTAVLLGCLAWTLLTMSAAAAPARTALTIDITGHQWWWEVRYGAGGAVAANEIHIPVGQPVRLRLASADVIHSFWVPQLAGKTDLIPGQANTMWLQADRAGDYRGQCAEYCGAQHAHMALHVIAEDAHRFAAWRARQLADSVAPAAGPALRGMQVFGARCARCHAVRGGGARGVLGPDLTHLMRRSTIAAGILPNNTGSLSGWIADPQALKPGALMPRTGLEPEDLRAVVAYLQTLQ